MIRTNIIYILFKNIQGMSKVQRITQLQCEQMNLYLKQQLNMSVYEALKLFPKFLAKYYMQIEAFIGFAFYRLSVALDKPQPGDLLQNIRFVKLSKIIRILWFIFTVIVPYFKGKLSNYQKITSFIKILQKIWSTFQFINLSIFIVKGQYRNLLQRILSIKMSFIDAESKRILNFSLMNRMLLWKIYQLFLQTVLPSLHNAISKTLKNVFYLSSYMQINDKDGSCGYCSEAVTMAMKSKPCEHIACYYCFSIAQDSKRCPKCSKQISQWVQLF